MLPTSSIGGVSCLQNPKFVNKNREILASCIQWRVVDLETPMPSVAMKVDNDRRQKSCCGKNKLRNCGN